MLNDDVLNNDSYSIEGIFDNFNILFEKVNQHKTLDNAKFREFKTMLNTILNNENNKNIKIIYTDYPLKNSEIISEYPNKKQIKYAVDKQANKSFLSIENNADIKTKTQHKYKRFIVCEISFKIYNKMLTCETSEPIISEIISNKTKEFINILKEKYNTNIVTTLLVFKKKTNTKNEYITYIIFENLNYTTKKHINISKQDMIDLRYDLCKILNVEPKKKTIIYNSEYINNKKSVLKGQPTL